MAVTFSYHPDSPDELRVSLIKRNGTESSWGNTWERAGGTPDEGGPDHHPFCNPGKQGGDTNPAFENCWQSFHLETGDIVLMRTRGFIAIDHEVTRDNGETIKNENTMAQRIWSGKMQQAAGHSSVKISDEHLDHCWFTEYEVRSAALYEQDTPQGPFATLRAKRDTVLLAFELFSQSQGQKLPPSRDIVR
ncbi:hypothetical protein N7491_006236 [Penicillium cf. griseofulvum]|nr:hypothetical protein N7491_006236 [Penicillium cf. griseofulvum]